MTFSRKQLRAQLVLIEKKIDGYQSQKQEYKKVLTPYLGGDSMALMIILVPSFMMGWRIARSRAPLRMIMRLMAYVI